VSATSPDSEPTPLDATPLPAPADGVGSAGVDRWLLALVASHVCLALLVFEPTLFPGADAGHYIVLGEALRNGLGFRDIHLPGMPLHAKYPPGYPLVLGVTGWVGGLQVFKLVSLAFTTGAVWLAYRIGHSIVGRGTALVIAAVVAVSPVMLDYSHRVLSEAAFTFLLLLAVAATGRRGRWGVLAIAVATAAFFTRTAGLAVLLSLAVYPALTREWRRATVVLAAGAVCVLGWALYQYLAQPSQPGYLQQIVLLNPYDPAAGRAGLAEFPVRAARNFWRYVSSEFPGSLGFATIRRGTVAHTAVIGVLLSTLAVAGWVQTALRRVTVPHLVTAFYVGMIVLWPPVWTDRRLLLPILPLLVLWMGAGVGALKARHHGMGLGMGGFVAGGVAVASLLASAVVVPDRLACQSSYRLGHPCDRDNYSEFYAMARWAADNTPPSAVIANRSPATFFLFSRRQGDLYRYSPDPDIVLRGLEEMGADYVVVDRLSATTDMYLVPAVGAHLERFEIVHVIGGEEGTMMLRLLPVPRTAMAIPRP
jgi:hypothetical protein